jgi:ATP-binding cassette subfamily B protein RtxB
MVLFPEPDPPTNATLSPIPINMLLSMFQQPLNQLTSLWQEFLQTKIAIERLSSILNTPAEKKKKTFLVLD